MEWESFLGRFHPILVHLPIGIFILGFCFELLLQFHVRWLKNARRFIILTYSIGLFFGILAALTGWWLSWSGHYKPIALENHKLLGIMTLVLMLLVIIFQIKGAEHRSRLKFLMSTVAIVLTGLTGHFGGNLTHGSDYLFKYASKSQQDEGYMPMVDVKKRNADSVEIYTDLIKPLIEAKCYACHNSEISRGGLVLESYSDFFKDENHERPITPGNVQKSELFYRMTLADDDEKVMPPRGNRVDYTNLQVLKYWIDNGADSLATFDSQTMSAELIALLQRDYRLDYSPRPYYEKVVVDSVDTGLISSLNASGFVANYLAETNRLLDVRFIGDSIQTEQIALINQVADHITFLDLKAAHLKDRHLNEISKMPHLTRINLSKNDFSHSMIPFLLRHIHLESVNFNETALDLNSLKQILVLPNLSRLYLYNTHITAEELQDLERTYANIQFVSEFKFEEVKEAKSVFEAEELEK